MPFELGAQSRAHLVGVHPKLADVVERAIFLSLVDFGVHEGMRTIETQREYVRTGVSRTMDSKHLPQDDGLSHAVDLVPYVAGKLRWEWPPIYKVAAAVRMAAIEKGLPLTWGGVWDRRLADLPEDADGIAAAVQEYQIRHAGPDFLDGPHYQVADA